MEERKDNDSADDNSGNKTTRDATVEVVLEKGKHVSDIFEIAGSLVFGSFSVACFESGFHKLGFLFVFLAVFCGLAVTTHHLKKFGLKHVRTCFWLSVILSALIFSFLAFKRPNSTPKPHFKLTLWKLNERKINLQITNDFLFSGNNSFSFSGKHGVLLIPLLPGQSNVVLRFLLQNDSPAAAADLDVMIEIHRRLNPLPTAGWSVNLLSDDDTNDISLNMKSPFSVLSGDGMQLPELSFLPEIDSVHSAVNSWPFGVYIRANDMPPMMIKLGLSFIATTELKPQIIAVDFLQNDSTKKHRVSVPSVDAEKNSSSLNTNPN